MKRYILDENGLSEDSTGTLIKYSDYETLEKENRELREGIEEVRRKSMYHSDGYDYRDITDNCTDLLKGSDK